MKKTNWAKLSLAETAARISEHLQARGYATVLVGGACVSIYSDDRYQSLDLDYVAAEPLKQLAAALKPLHFIRGSGRHFTHPDSPYLIEFIAPPVAIGNEAPITRTARHVTKAGIITMLTATDCVKDRLAAFIHWHDPQALEQSLMVAAQQNVNLGQIRQWAKNERGLPQYETFRRKLAARRKIAIRKSPRRTR